MSDTVVAGCDDITLYSHASTVTTCTVDLDLTPPVAVYLYYADSTQAYYADNTALEYA